MYVRTILALAAGGLFVGCGLNQEGVAPPGDAISFPASALVDGRWLYVTNSNSDLRYNDGTLVVVDLDQTRVEHDSGRGLVAGPGGQPVEVAWEPCKQVDHIDARSADNLGRCCWDQLDRNILNCDERRYVQQGSTVRIGSFAASMVAQNLNQVCTKPPNA